MWMLQILIVAVALGLIGRMPERVARLAIIPVILLLLAYQTLKYGLV